ncbi:contractile injection system tape measure protein [Yokenella regensburgei]|uniref:contractile injection system tape measure protein n=1 Tax=Yokenella regensburgei TaxID=158877 RepID=UPI003ED8CA22
MEDVTIEKLCLELKGFKINVGRDLLKSQLIKAENIKKEVEIAILGRGAGEINADKWVINLGIIPATQFDTLFIPRLAQAFAERLACEQASIVGQQVIKMATSNATESSVLLDEKHLDGEGLIQLARSCLTPQTFKALLQESTAYQLQQLLKLLLERAWQFPEMLPVCWYSRVTANRLSIAAMLYLLKSQRGHDWLMHQYSPTASQVTDWAKAIDQGEVPPEQVAELLTGNRPSDSILLGQPTYPALIVMRWLLPLWRQPAVRKAIHRLKGGRGVQRLDAYLSRCLQRQDGGMQEEKGMQSAPAQVVLTQDNTVLFQNWGMESDVQQVALPPDSSALLQGREGPPDVQQVALPPDSSALPQGREGPPDAQQVALSPDSSALLQGREGPTDAQQVALPPDSSALPQGRGGGADAQQVALSPDRSALPQGRGIPSDALQIALSRDNSMLPACEGIPTASRHTMQHGKGSLRSPNTPCSSSQGISNAGLLLLWPLLPQLFSLLGLWKEEQFVSDAARWQALYGLDRLVWGEANPPEGRLTLSQVLCGGACSASVPPSTPLSQLQLQQIDDWLTAIGQQFPGWQKLSLTDIRQLFLQRAGEISTQGTVPQISVWPEPWDFLLRDWPWPMTLASFPWTEQPLTIVWPLNGLTG